jgi:LPS-assembly protein
LMTVSFTSKADPVKFGIYSSINDTLPQPASSDTSKKSDISFKKKLPPPVLLDEDGDTVRPKPIDTALAKIKADTFHVKMSGDSLNAPVVYHADDSMVMDVPSKKIILYGKGSKTKYQNNELTAPGIEFDQGHNMVTAFLKKDTLGNVIAYPVFNQGDLKTVSDTIQFNMKSGKGITKGSYTQQGDIFIYGEKIKKVSPDVFYAYKGRFTTCNLDTPHFAFVSKKIKFINKKFAITGPVHLEFEGVPVPIYLPFGIFPLLQGKHSGILPPTFTEDQQYGIALQGIGYYKVLSDNWDATVRGTIYSYGSWIFNGSSTYYKRYHYRGNFSFGYQDMKLNFKGDPDYQVTKTFDLIWNHSMDSKARPGVTFGANVNIQSAQNSYNQFVVNNPVQNYTNQSSSSIQYSKVWKDKPFNLSISASDDQNSVNKSFNITLPTVSFNVNTLYPFRKKESTGITKWYENIGIALNSSASSTTSFLSDSATLSQISTSQQISKNFVWGATHNVPISLSLPPMGPLQITPSVSYQEKWYQKKIYQRWNAADTTIDTTYQSGFYTARNMSFGVGVATRIFGMYTFSKDSKIQAIRHEIRPTLSLSYTPDMNSQYYYNLQYDSSKNDIERASVFDGINGGAFSEQRFMGLSFGLDNHIEMKVRDPKDTSANGTKKVTLLDNFGITGNYNFIADSFRMSTLPISAGTSLFNNKLRVTAGGSLDPYELDTNGRRIDRLVWKDKIFTLGRLTNASISLSTQFQGGDQKNKNPNGPGRNLSNLPYDPASGLSPDEYQAETADITANPGLYADFTIPWSVNLAYSFSYARSQTLRTVTRNFIGDTVITPTAAIKTFSQSVTFNGTLGLSAKWQLSLSSTYNITLAQLGYWQLSLSRDLHCWQMSISVSNSGYSRSFSITISPKSGILRDLKLNRARSFENY